MVADVTCGLAAAVVLSVADDGIVRGASVGDCEAWIFGSGKAFDLTGSQRRKPMLGSGDAEPVAFYGQFDSGTLVMGTDGLWKYAALSRIGQAVDQSLDDALVALLDAVRLRGGTLQDDIALAVCRRALVTLVSGHPLPAEPGCGAWSGVVRGTFTSARDAHDKIA
jgi:hypothetical protein